MDGSCWQQLFIKRFLISCTTSMFKSKTHWISDEMGRKVKFYSIRNHKLHFFNSVWWEKCAKTTIGCDVWYWLSDSSYTCVCRFFAGTIKLRKCIWNWEFRWNDIEYKFHIHRIICNIKCLISSFFSKKNKQISMLCNWYLKSKRKPHEVNVFDSELHSLSMEEMWQFRVKCARRRINLVIFLHGELDMVECQLY